MKNYIILLFSVLMISLNAQIKESREVTSFKEIEVKSGINITYRLSSIPKIVVKTDKKEHLRHIITNVNNHILEVYIDSKDKKNLSINNIEVIVFGGSLDKLSMASGAVISFEDEMQNNQFYVKLTSGSQAYFKNLISENLDINLSSGSQLKGKIASNHMMAKINSGSNWNSKIAVKHININISSGAKVELNGNTDTLKLKATSGSHSNLRNLKINDANIVASSASFINCWVDKKLIVDANSASNIMIKGQPSDSFVQKDKLSKILNEEGKAY